MTFQASWQLTCCAGSQDYKDKVGDDPTKHFTDEELKERDRHVELLGIGMLWALVFIWFYTFVASFRHALVGMSMWF